MDPYIEKILQDHLDLKDQQIAEGDEDIARQEDRLNAMKEFREKLRSDRLIIVNALGLGETEEVTDGA